MIIKFRKDFKRHFKKLSPKIKEKIRERLRLFEIDQFNAVLNNHSLQGKYLGYRSINISGDLRALYMQIDNGIIFVTIDSHSNLYG